MSNSLINNTISFLDPPNTSLSRRHSSICFDEYLTVGVRYSFNCIVLSTAISQEYRAAAASEGRASAEVSRSDR